MPITLTRINTAKRLAQARGQRHDSVLERAERSGQQPHQKADRVELKGSKALGSEGDFFHQAAKLKAWAQKTNASAPCREKPDDPALAELSDKAKAQYKKLVEKYPQSGQDLQKLLESRKLTAKDGKGTSVLEHLSRLEEKLGEKKIGKDVMASLVKQLVDPEQIRQGSYSICAQTSIEYIHARDNPADYSRIVVDLVTQGASSLKDGERLTLNPSGLQDDASGRSATSRIFQSSISDFANGDELGYDNATQFHGKPGQKIVEVDRLGKDGKWEHFGLYWDQLEVVDPKSPKVGREMVTIKTPDGQQRQVYADTVSPAKHGGLNNAEALKALQALTGEKLRVHSKGEYTGVRLIDSLLPESWGRESLESAIKRNIQDKRTTYVAMNWSKDPATGHSSHALAVVDIRDGYVYLRNPWGSGEQGQADGPKREVLDQEGNIRMTLEEFHQRVQFVVEPE